MSNSVLVQTRIDADVKAKATAILEKSGLTLSDAVRILLTRTANEGSLPIGLTSATSNSSDYDAWFKAKVNEALEDKRAPLSHEKVSVRFDAKRCSLMEQIEKL